MRLKQIKLAGFKSFVEPTVVSLPGSRCAVVGPNGCGKSNVIDAVRWVMGESSAKNLRGENLTDVIFNGSNGRKPTSMASIELLFDNSDGRIGGQYSAYSEISIRRQVTRDAQSNYFLNGTKCRRRDIQDVFLGTGFGPRSYSIIEQGMISQLVEAKPDELRVYLEEAAGISKYKERRRETENRIKHTRENLDRINDIREELGRQLEKLERQAKAAEKYRELKKEESLLTAQLFSLRSMKIQSELSLQEKSIGNQELKLERTISEQRNTEANIERARQESVEITENFNSVQGNFYKVGSEITRLEEAIQFNQQRIKQLEEDQQKARERHSEIKNLLLRDEKEIRELEARSEISVPKLNELVQLDQAVQERLRQAEDQMRQWQRQWDEFAESSSANARDLEVQQSRVEYTEQLLSRLGRRAIELDTLSKQQLVEDDQGVAEIADEIVTLEESLRSLDRSVDQRIASISSLKERAIIQQDELDQARTNHNSLMNQLGNLKAVQDVSLRQEASEAEDWIQEQRLQHAGRLGEVLSVVPGWERALEIVLGDFIRAMQVDNLNDFASSLHLLTAGDVALVEKGSISDAGMGSHGMDLPTLASLLRSDSEGANALLYGVFAAESPELAMEKRQFLSPGQSIITRDGFWVGADWVRVLHEAESQDSIIERGQLIETLELEVEEHAATVNELLSERARLKKLVEEAESERESTQEEINALNKVLGERRTQHGVTKVRVDEAAARMVQLKNDRSEVSDQIRQEKEKLEAAVLLVAELESKKTEDQATKERLAASRQSLEAGLLELQRDSKESIQELNDLKLSVKTIQSSISARRTALNRTREQEAEIKEQLTSIEAGIEASKNPIPVQRSEMERKLEQRSNLEKEMTVQKHKVEEISEVIETNEVHRRRIESEIDEIRSVLERIRVEREGLAVQKENLLDQMRATGVPQELIEADIGEDAKEEDWVEELDRVARRIQRLGSINLAAIDEYGNESERKTYLDSQAEDLETAMSTLLDAIKKIDAETRTRFKETFEIVNTRFGELFPKVFGGGRAYLELTGEDLLDTGVALMARPPGKRNSSIHLLSGGEKAMTAIALIFAIFHLNPSPVCMLDEVDAPLDDMNVARFADLIAEMSADVQFMVVTHNKITMEMADYLIGVTMNEPGVSRLVSVNVEEAAAMAVV